MSNLAVKEVEFQGDTLMAVQNTETNEIHVGVKWICEGIGLTKGQMQNERKRIQEDLVLKQGERNLVLPTNGGMQETLCIELSFLPLWLAKIPLTPKMKQDNPFITQKLVDYQLKAKDVLAEAFIQNNQLSKELTFLQGMLDQMKDNEIKMKQLEYKTEITSNKISKLETEFNKETVDEGYASNDFIARQLNLFSTTNRPHFNFIDAIAKHLRIYNTTIGYKDKYVNVRRETVKGGQVGTAIYYSEDAVELMKEFLDNEFSPKREVYSRTDKKGLFKKASFELDKNYNFNEKTYSLYIK